MRTPIILGLVAGLAATGISPTAGALEPTKTIDLWPDMAPGETERSPGKVLPKRPGEHPAVTRVEEITRPTMDIFKAPAEKSNGTAVVILPGGGFGKVVPDKEGSEAAEWLNRLRVTAFVVRYRTAKRGDAAPWLKAVQDGQRALSLVRSEAETFGVDPERVGLLGFSAGGQAAAILMAHPDKRFARAVDAVDEEPFAPDFGLLVYPWRVADPETGQLKSEIAIDKRFPPTFLVHTHDDASTSLGSVGIYAALKRQGVPAELHIYQNGGHGYGLRPVEGSEVHTWPDRATSWLRVRGLIEPPASSSSE
ncbi:Acetylxylan esterase precursor [Planctomycetes bacterium Pan216]|uniref:Acetylxylan esterase n=1 Tax=Kolteria novifilia TaxID=2527975 RepID=A0A518AYP2_9BACT|nr:Acetylxylan esterase precursor [Planctomycetes bacterium Pan216]